MCDIPTWVINLLLKSPHSRGIVGLDLEPVLWLDLGHQVSTPELWVLTWDLFIPWNLPFDGSAMTWDLTLDLMVLTWFLIWDLLVSIQNLMHDLIWDLLVLAWSLTWDLSFELTWDAFVLLVVCLPTCLSYFGTLCPNLGLVSSGLAH